MEYRKDWNRHVFETLYKNSHVVLAKSTGVGKSYLHIGIMSKYRAEDRKQKIKKLFNI